MDAFLNLFLVNLLAAASLMSIGWIFSLIKKDVTIADSLWGLGFVLIAWLTFFRTDGFLLRKILITGIVTVWGLRLFIHLNIRNRGKGEDPRYGQWREKHGQAFWIVSLFKVFLVQALFQWLIAMGVQYGQISKTPAYLTLFDVVGFLMWTAGIIIESFADLQLKQFLSDAANKGKIMNRKLWKYSRHPNYFGETLIWWGIFVIVLSTPWGFWTIVSPLLITYTLLKLTGVTLMEETQFGDNPEYQQYIRETSSFIPWFPKISARAWTYKKETYVRVKDLKGNEFICAIDALKDIKHATNEELTDCVDDATVGRYAGNIDIADNTDS